MKEKQAKKKDLLRQGIIVFAALAGLTILEFIVAHYDLFALIWILLLIKAGLVLWYYMHIYRVFQADEGGH
jgi:heme/copper-type cytochrome/quinol oxidase subunit 4